MDKKLFAVLIAFLLVGTAVGYSWFQIVELEKRISGLERDVKDLEERYETLSGEVRDLNDSLSDRINGLNNSLGELRKAHGQGEQQYFFIQDPNFTTPLDRSIYWGVEAWNRNPDSLCEVKDGTLRLFYNGTIDYSYGNSGVFQGQHTDGRVSQRLLVGSSLETAHHEDYVILPRTIENGRFWLETRFRINQMGFNCYPTVYGHPGFSRVNLGLTLMCAINNTRFSSEAQTLWLDVYFAGYCLNETSIWTVPRDWNYTNCAEDVFAGYFVGEFGSQEFDKWIPLSLDLGHFITRTLNQISCVNINSIRVYGFILFVECLGAYAEVEYDYVNTVRQ